MATKRITLTGEAYWAKVFTENREMKDYQGVPHTFDGLYKIELKLDKENKAILKASGSALKGRFNDDGEFFATFKRKHKDRFDWASGAPKVISPEGTPWTLEDNGIIPNGSIISVDATVYTTSMTPGTRLESVTIINLANLPPREDQPAAEPSVAPTETSNTGVEVPF